MAFASKLVLALVALLALSTIAMADPATDCQNLVLYQNPSYQYAARWCQWCINQGRSDCMTNPSMVSVNSFGANAAYVNNYVSSLTSDSNTVFACQVQYGSSCPSIHFTMNVDSSPYADFSSSNNPLFLSGGLPTDIGKSCYTSKFAPAAVVSYSRRDIEMIAARNGLSSDMNIIANASEIEYLLKPKRKSSPSLTPQAVGFATYANGRTATYSAGCDQTTGKDWSCATAPVGDQGQCRSCYAFAAAAMYEGAVAVKYLKTVAQGQPSGQLQITASTRLMRDCSSQSPYLNGGCSNGGYAGSVVDMVNQGGVPIVTSDTNTQYFTSVSNVNGNPACSYAGDSSRSVSYTTSNAVIISQGFSQQGESYIQSLIDQYGIGTVLWSGGSRTSFVLYKSGVYNDPLCGGGNMDHQMAITGYDFVSGAYATPSGNGAWILKNSWGVNWGNNGYVKVEAGANRCGVAAGAVFIY